jgi:aminoglycoside phosphotransferase (APT) family kinase protein
LDVEVDGVAQKFVLRIDSRRIEHEYEVLRAMESIPIPTPRVFGWNPEGEELGMPCFFSDFVEGKSLLKPTLAGEPWAEELYIDTVVALQEITRSDLSAEKEQFENEETADNILEAANDYFKIAPDPLAEAIYDKLKATIPILPEARFSNGDLWLDNLIVRDRILVGVIDFENAGFSDPIYEFLLPFFVAPELRGRGIEQRYCKRMGFDADSLHWYHGLEYFDTWHWVRSTGKPFIQYNDESLSHALKNWLATM